MTCDSMYRMAQTFIGDRQIMNMESLNTADRARVEKLIGFGQQHLFADWDAPGVNDEAKTAFLESLAKVDDAYPGGLIGYISNARTLLAAAKEDRNSFEGFVPHQPNSVDLTAFDETYDHYESLGKKQFSKLAVVLVAGGLGERLGYNGIKLDIPVEVVETTSYLAHYAACLKAMEAGMESPQSVPFVIMVSPDTDAKTLHALESNQYFGLRKEQVHILRQSPVPAISDNNGTLTLEEKYKLILKPHGHGDVHMLFHTSGLAAK